MKSRVTLIGRASIVLNGGMSDVGLYVLKAGEVVFVISSRLRAKQVTMDSQLRNSCHSYCNFYIELLLSLKWL